VNTPSPAAVAEALDRFEPAPDFSLPGRTNHIMAATLVPLRWSADLTAVFTLRSTGLRQHAGEVCFPGGTPEAQDGDLLTTALREAEEELGIVRPRILGQLSRIPVYTSDHRITPFVAAIDDTPLRPAPYEVAQILELSVPEILREPTIEGLPFPMKGTMSWSPLFHVDGHVIYGATAHTFLELLEVLAPLFGLSVPPFARGDTEWADLLPPGVTV